MATIPVGEATELDPVKLNPTQPMLRRAAGVSPTVDAAAPVDAAAADAAQPAAGGLRRAMATAKSMFTGGAGGAAANTAETAAGTGSRILSGLRTAGNVAGKYVAPFALGATAAAAASTPTSDYNTRFGLDPNAPRDGVGGAVKDMGVRALGAASDLGATIFDPLTGGAVSRQFADKQAAQQPTPGAPAPGVDGAGGAANAEGPSPSLSDGNITRSGNTFSGTNVKAVNGAADPLSYIPPSGQTATQGDVMGAAKGLDAYGPGAHAPDGSGGLGAASFGGDSAHNANFNAEERQYQLKEGLNSTDRGVRSQAMAGIAQGDATGSGERIAQLNQQAETTRALAANRLQSSIHDAANTVTMRGQDKELQGKMAPALLAQANRSRLAGYFGGNPDNGVRGAGPGASGDPSTASLAQLTQARDRALAGGDDASAKSINEMIASQQSVASSQQTGRDAAYSALHGKIAGMIPPTAGPDGKSIPDAAKAAQYATGLNTKLAETQGVLEKRVAANPNDTAARTLLDKIHTQGVGALGEDDIADHVAGHQAAELRDQYGSGPFNPVGGTPINSNAPVSGLRLHKNVFGDTYDTLGTDGKPDGGSIPARAVDHSGSFFGLGVKDNRFDRLKRGGMRDGAP